MFALVESVPSVTPMSAVIAALTFLNGLGIFGAIFYFGKYVGSNDTKWTEADKKLANLDGVIILINNQNVNAAKTEAALSSFKEDLAGLKEDLMRARKRSHDLSNIMTRLILEGGAKLGPGLPGSETKTK
jgi:hypothetical protein